MTVQIAACSSSDSHEIVLYAQFRCLEKKGELFSSIENGIWKSEPEGQLLTFLDSLYELSDTESLDQLGAIQTVTDRPSCLFSYRWHALSIKEHSGYLHYETIDQLDPITDHQVILRDSKYLRDSKRHETASIVVDCLLDLGYLSVVDPFDREMVRNHLVAELGSGQFETDEFHGSPSRRCYSADSEDLLELGIASFFFRSREFWRRSIGIDTSTVAAAYDAKTQCVHVGGKSGTVRDDHLAADLIALCDDWLINGGSQDRAYPISSGNDFEVAFLSNAMADCLNHSGLLSFSFKK